MQKQLIFSNISLSYLASENRALDEAASQVRHLGLKLKDYSFHIFKKSVDARKKHDIRIVYSVAAELKEGLEWEQIPAEKLARVHASFLEDCPVEIRTGTKQSGRPMVVGMGPAGLFAALIMAENGYRPIVIDRGDSVQNRIRDVERFSSEGILDENSNIQFGAGGAGTFSDGKLMTRIKDPYCSYVFRRLTEFGAPQDILVQAHPHVGTDYLRMSVQRILDRIESLGGTLVYRCCYLGSTELADGTVKVTTSKGDFSCCAVILAIGNSSRDTYLELIRHQFDVVSKPISVGVRIEHLRSDIEKFIYGDAAGHPALGAAEYHLSDTTDSHGVYTFCMCPGGYVMAAASEEGRLVTNGMSLRARDGKNSNAAIAVSVLPEDVQSVNGSMVEGMIAFQRQIEHNAYLAGGSDWKAPVQTVGDLLDGTSGTEPSRVIPSYRNGLFRVSGMTDIFPHFVVDGLQRGILSFNRTISGFASRDAVLTAPETRTSAPARISRNEDRTAIGHPWLYPCGEGAGYAGGITSAAVDGMRSAIALMSVFAPQP